MQNTKNTEVKMSFLKSKVGQSAVEFIIIMGVVLVFFVVFLTVIKGKQNEKVDENEKILMQNLVLDIKEEINIAATASEGYHREFEIPDNVRGREFKINLTDDNYVSLESERHSFSYKTSEVNGTIIKGGINIIRKENGTVYLN